MACSRGRWCSVVHEISAEYLLADHQTLEHSGHRPYLAKTHCILRLLAERGLVKGGVFFVAPHETSCELHALEKLVGWRQTKRRLVPGPVHSLVKVVGVHCRHVSAATFYRCVAAGGMKNLLSFTFRSTALTKGGVGRRTISNELLIGFKGYKFVGGELNTKAEGTYTLFYYHDIFAPTLPPTPNGPFIWTRTRS